MLAHAFDPSTWQRQSLTDLCEFKAHLLNRASSRSAKQKKHCLQGRKKERERKKFRNLERKKEIILCIQRDA